jgi:hypothetical protein
MTDIETDATSGRSSNPMMILIAGPYRSGTNDEPALLRRNLERLEQAAWPLFAAGHLPVIGEWVALPVLRRAGSTSLSDPLAQTVLYPTASRFVAHCDAVLRPPGRSTGADQDVAIATARGIPVYHRIQDVPPARPLKPTP